MSDIRLILGEVEFSGFEVPEELPFGSTQRVKRHEFVGNSHALDAMGSTPKPMRWEGRFRGIDAISRAKTVEAMCKAGDEVALTCGDLSYTVIVIDFEARQAGAREVPYSIEVDVVRDEGQPSAEVSTVGPNQMVGADFLNVSSLAAGIGSTTLTASLGPLGAAIRSVGNFATASRSVLAGVMGPLLDAEAIVGGLIETAELTVGSFGGVGGVIAGADPRDMAASLLAELSATVQAADLYEAESYLGRIEVNVDAIGSSGAQIVTAGADLFRLALDHYGDASEWSTIAAANGFTDPILSGVLDVIIPATPVGAGGVLS